MSKENKPRRRRNKYLRAVENIQAVASSTKELTYQQALSVLLRHRQLVREGALHPNTIPADVKAKQIEDCYRQRAEQKA